MNSKRAYSIDENVIAKLLRVGALSPAECDRRAHLVAEDLRWIDFEELSLFCRGYPLLNERGGEVVQIPIPEYRFGVTGFSIDNAVNAQNNIPTWFGGTGLDRGHLQFLSQVSLVARQAIPKLWLRSKRLRDALRNPPQHLSAIEEIWWLGRWANIESVELGRAVKSNAKTDVDWSLLFDGGSLRINVEVKRILLDCMRHTRNLPFNSRWFAEFCAKEVLPKFAASQSNEINLLAISLFGEIDRQVQTVVSEWLAGGQTVIDGVLIATRESRRRSRFDQQLFSEKARLTKHLLNPLPPEDSGLAFALEVPVSIPGLSLPV